MITINASKAGQNIFKLIDTAADSGQVISIIGQRNNAVLISESDWKSIEETLYLMSVPGMRESLVEGLNTPLEDCVELPEY